jgi:hypothetical protein
MNETDQTLKQFLAKCLPEKIWYTEQPRFYWRPELEHEVLDTELLHICWMVEETFNNEDAQHFYNLIHLNPSAPWQQRATALKQVLEKE